MVFSSITFLFYFLPLFLVLYFISPFKNTVLLVASLFFYAWGEAEFVLLLLASIGINFFFGLLIDKHTGKKKKVALAVGVAANLLLIGYFKYFTFFLRDIIGAESVSDVHLPLGISFFTFQAISYLVDIYRKEAKVEKNIFNLALYISMFPQLVAGPIVRFKSVTEQIHNRSSSLAQVVSGVKIFMIGLGQKTLLANTFAEPADAIFALNEATLTTATAWLGALCYTFQIYFDFAGYSNMAIGLGLVMGFHFPKNFNYPYVSQSITEFWRRWHMSLSSWFRDYLYIPLGGNRRSSARTYLNLFLVFFLCGLWHGAAWPFIIWGLYHGGFLIVERAGFGEWLNAQWRPLRHVYTLLVVVIGWVIFRAENFDQLSYYLTAMIGKPSGETLVFVFDYFMTNSLAVVFVVSLVFSTPLYGLVQSLKEHKTQPVRFSGFVLLEIFYISVFLLSVLSVASGSYNPFIYFRF
jgi:alginate O-acetyltransferase complex protein AlgI